MPNSNSKLSLSINDQYFTPIDTAKWCFDRVHSATGWDFKGTALEPAVGAFSFIIAAEQLGLELEWTTNDLFPQTVGNRRPDFAEDFKTFDFGVYNYVITNPPFGKSNCLARAFMKKGLALAPRVMMLLPRGVRRVGFQDSMPRNAKRVLDLTLEDETFITSTDEVKKVKTCVQAWETGSETFPKIKDTLDLRSDLFDWRLSQDEDWADDMDLQVTRWGATMGRMVPKERQRQSGSLISVILKNIDEETFISIQESLDFSDYEDMCTAAPAFDMVMWVHRFNSEAVRRGLLVPVDKVSQ